MEKNRKKLENWITAIKIIASLVIVCISTYVLFTPKLFCGEINEKLQGRIHEAGIKLGDFFIVEPIPCEDRYVNVKLKQVDINQTLLDSLHSILYNREKREGWATIVVYDKNGNYIISHSSNNKLYKQSGD